MVTIFDTPDCQKFLENIICTPKFICKLNDPIFDYATDNMQLIFDEFVDFCKKKVKQESGLILEKEWMEFRNEFDRLGLLLPGYTFDTWNQFKNKYGMYPWDIGYEMNISEDKIEEMINEVLDENEINDE
jgi:hypothetical protein